MSEQPLEGSASSTRVLAVDDDRFMRAYIDAVLGEAGIEVTTAEAPNAVWLLDENEYDLIVCDWRMPDISGLDFLSMVRSEPRFDLTQFMFLTVSEDLEDLVAGLEGGADDYLTKPFHPSEFVARVRNRLERSDQIRRRKGELLDIETFDFEVERELTRVERGDVGGALALVNIPILEEVGASLGARERRQVLEAIAGAMGEAAGPLDMIGATRRGNLALLLPATKTVDAANRLRSMATKAAALITEAQGLRIRPVPMIGFVEFESRSTETSETLFERAREAASDAWLTQDLQPRRWIPSSHEEGGEKTDHKPTRETIQVGTTFTLGILLPFVLYVLLWRIGFDVSWAVYLVTVIALVSTAALIWTEGVFAARHPGPPPESGAPAPPASAIICAYLPNEAGTIIETLESFFEIDYKPGIQVILAYNTPRDLPVEDELRAIAAENPELHLLRVEGSNSKAQNLNAAIAVATGDFIGVFDADHKPDPDSYHRAWLWLSNGFDVVQGHCLVRNPEETFLARMVAVEFETIYAVNHPGRWLRDGFGIFGGSNGYWRTEVLHMTRMRGSMLTEDIDSSMRVLEAGGHIASDPGLISRELATTTARQIWNQRLRWAQGWAQVSIRHLWAMLRLPSFNTRQRFGVWMLLFQREIYPWVSIQIFPLLAFWWVRGDIVDWYVPIFVLATIFTASVGPGMTLMAYHLSHPTIKKKSWFLQYALFSIFFYTEAKNVIARVAHLKEALGETSWRVTPRSADPSKGSIPPEVMSPLMVELTDTNHHDEGDPSAAHLQWIPSADAAIRSSIETFGSELAIEAETSELAPETGPPTEDFASFLDRVCPDIDPTTALQALNTEVSDGELRAAAKLDLEPSELSALSFFLWGRPFSTERDRRTEVRTRPDASPLTIRAARGHATRELIEEVADHLEWAAEREPVPVG